MTSDMAKKAPKGPIDLLLEHLNQDAEGAQYVAVPQDHFTLQGPNGVHQCVVLPFLGPCVSPRIWYHFEDHNSVLKSMCLQTAKALHFLHENGICHGDFRPANILTRLKDMDHLSELELKALLGYPEMIPVGMESGSELPGSAPRYVDRPVNLSVLGPYLTDQICLIDFGESFHTSSPPRELGIPEHYLPPEILLKDDAAVIGLASDIWALGSTLFEIRQQMALIYMIDDPDEILSEMVQILGKFPDHLWNQWKKRSDFFDEDGKRLNKRPNSEDRTLEWNLKQIFERRMPKIGHDTELEVRRLALDEEEQKSFGDLLRKLLQYDPKERPSVGKALEHEYFRV